MGGLFMVLDREGFVGVVRGEVLKLFSGFFIVFIRDERRKFFVGFCEVCFKSNLKG